MRYLAIAFLASLAWGCGPQTEKVAPKAAESTSASMPAGWKQISVENIELGLPKDWQVADLIRADLAKMLGELKFGASGEALKGQIRQMAASGIFKLFAFGPKNDAGFQENVNVNVMPVPNESLEEGKNSILTQMKAVAKTADAQIISDPKGILVTAEMQAQSPSGPISYATRGYVLVKDGKAYTFTFSSSMAGKAAMAAFADKAAKTIRLK